MTEHMEQIKHSNGRESFQKHVKESDEKKEKSQKGTWDQLMHQPAPPRKAHFLRTNGRELSCQNPLPMNSWHDFKKQKPTKIPDSKKIFLLTEWKCGVPSHKGIFEANFNCPNSVGDVITIHI